MMRSLYAGVTGLRNHQTRMDVIGNNISNVNTVGFKSSRVVFQDLYSQTIGSGSANSWTVGTSTGLGGTNPKQIGLGVTVSAIDVIHTPGANQYSGRGLDVALNGEGFFIVERGGQQFYTRAGNFYQDDKHYLVNSAGDFIMTYGATKDANGNYSPNTAGGLGKFICDDTDYDNYTINSDGAITAIKKADNSIETLGYIALATFPNTNGLEKVGGNLYQQTASSGVPKNTTPGRDGTEILSVGSLEMSNVDLGAEFVDMIVTQRGFQANSRTITTTDTMLEELINLKR